MSRLLRRVLGPAILFTAAYLGSKWRLPWATNQEDVSLPDWAYEPEALPEGTFSRSMVAVGDLHGDFPNMMKVLQMGKVVDHEGNWTGDVDYFVQTGDIIDRYVGWRWTRVRA